MLVIKDWHTPSLFAKHHPYFIKEPFTRIKLLTELIHRIFAVFADQQRGIDGQFLRAQGEGIANRGKYRNLKSPADCMSDVVGRCLVEIDRGNV